MEQFLIWLIAAGVVHLVIQTIPEDERKYAYYSLVFWAVVAWFIF